MAKSPDAFRTISEVAAQLETPAHVLRFWESKFTQVKPVKRAGGRRYYRPDDIALLAGIKVLLHEQGMTIRGVQKLLRERGARHVATLLALPWEGTDAAEEPAQDRAAPEAAGPEEADSEVADALLAETPPDPVVVGPWPGAGAEEAVQSGGDPEPRAEAPGRPMAAESGASVMERPDRPRRDRVRDGSGTSVSRLRDLLAEADRTRLGAEAARLGPLVDRLRALRDGGSGRPA